MRAAATLIAACLAVVFAACDERATVVLDYGDDDVDGGDAGAPDAGGSDASCVPAPRRCSVAWPVEYCAGEYWCNGTPIARCEWGFENPAYDPPCQGSGDSRGVVCVLECAGGAP